MNEKRLTRLIVIAVIILASFLFLNSLSSAPAGPARLDDFAKCLAEKKVMMYGAYWCSHCQNQKKEFGNSFQYVDYVECTKEPQRCLDAGVQSYPTWIFPKSASDSASPRLQGEVSLEKLAELSGCALP